MDSGREDERTSALSTPSVGRDERIALSLQHYLYSVEYGEEGNTYVRRIDAAAVLLQKCCAYVPQPSFLDAWLASRS